MSINERRYRAYYSPLDRDGFPVSSDTGVLPFVQIKADSAEQALTQAYALVGCPISEVQRLDPFEVTPPTDSVFGVLADTHSQAQARRFA